MKQDFETGNFIGAGESATFNILKHLTHLHYRSLRDFGRNGIYRQVPIDWVLHRNDLKDMSEAFKKGSLDFFIIFNQRKIAVRVQGNGHGKFLKGIGKSRTDKIQANLLKQYYDVVDIELINSRHVFKDEVTQEAIQEVIDSFKTAGVMIPVL